MSPKAVVCKAKNPETCRVHSNPAPSRDILANFKFKRAELIPGLNDLQTVNPTLTKEWHPTLNGELTPDKVKAVSQYRAFWQCKNGHSWQSRVTHRNTGHGGCRECVKVKLQPGVNDLATVNPCLAGEWHPTKNGNLTPDQVLFDSRTKVAWLGQCGHEYSLIIGDRNAGNGCQVCSGRVLLTGFNDLATANPERAAEWHSTKNGSLTPQDVRANDINTVVWWQCPTKPDHEWETSVANRNSDSLCPHCPIKTSKAEDSLLAHAESLGYSCQSSNRKILGGKEIDIVVENLKLGIEYHGVYWHSERRGKKTPDYHYNKWAKATHAGYEIMQIWEDDMVKNPDLVKKTITRFLGRKSAGTSSTRTLTGQPIDEAKAESFLTENYLKGFIKGSHYYGSTDASGDLKSVLVLGPNSNGHAEIKAYVNDTTESADLSALLKQASEAHGIKSFSATVDNCEAMGSLYDSNGFHLDAVQPSDFMYVKRGVRTPKDDAFVSDLLSRVHPKDHDRALESQNIDRIWDAGKTVFDISL